VALSDIEIKMRAMRYVMGAKDKEDEKWDTVVKNPGFAHPELAGIAL
jgi:hypothetical protein